MVDLNILDVIEDLRNGVQKDIENLISKILLASTIDDRVDLVGDAVVDGTTEMWSSALHMATTLEAYANEESVEGGDESQS